MSKVKSQQIEQIRGVVGCNVGFLSGPHQGTKAKAATKTGAGALRPKTDGSETDAKSQGENGRKKNGCKQATSGRSHAKTDASRTDEKRQGQNGRKQQAGKIRSKRTQAETGRTQAQTDAKWQGKNGHMQQASGCAQAKTYASSKRVHSGPNGCKTTRKNHTHASNNRVHSATGGCRQQAGALRPNRTQNDKAKTQASSKRVQNGRKQQLRGAHRTRTHTGQGAGEEPNPHVIGVKVICIGKLKPQN